jgi:hypothetical protein
VCGQDAAVEAARDYAELPLKHAELFSRVGVRAGRGILLEPKYESMRCEEYQITFGLPVETLLHWLTAQGNVPLASLLKEKWQDVLTAAAATDELTRDKTRIPELRRRGTPLNAELLRRQTRLIFCFHCLLLALKAVQGTQAGGTGLIAGGPVSEVVARGCSGRTTILIDWQAGWIQVASSGRVSFTSEEMAALTAAREEVGGVDATTLRTEHSISNPRRTLASLRDKLNVHPPLAAAYDADKQDGKWRLVWKAGRPTNPGQAPERYAAVT